MAGDIFRVDVSHVTTLQDFFQICIKFHDRRRQMVENLRKMQELRAQIQAQLKLADTLKKLNENAGEDNKNKDKKAKDNNTETKTKKR